MAESHHVLFVGHEATDTGAPILLLHLLRWLQANSRLSFDILLQRGGKLQPEFEALGPVSVLGPWQPGAAELPGRARRRLLLARFARRGDLVYSNTATNGAILEALGPGRPVITHVHELEMAIRSWGVKNMDAVKRQTTRYIACADTVRENLITNHAIPPERVDVVHGFIPVPSRPPDAARARARLRRELGVPETALIVGAAGYTSWTKAPDIFVQLAGAITRRNSRGPVHFVWVGGGSAGSVESERLHYDVRGLGLTNCVHFLERRQDVLDVFGAFDVLALVSREDSFPLVCLEAASMGVPCVCFDGAGGAREFVAADCGAVIPYLDVDAMASRIAQMLDADDLRRALGNRAREKLRTRHSVDVAAPRILALIERHFQ